MATLHRLARPDVARICAQQAVADLAAVAKELVENSLDAGASSIDVRLFELGAEGIEVIDNGCGIPESDFDSLVNSFGFRGEALHSLSTIAKLIVTTCTEATAPLGHRLVYDQMGETIERSRVARARGTTVHVSDLFGSLPVRAREFKRHIRKEYSKCIEMMQVYAVSCVGIRFTLSSITNKGSKTVLIQTHDANSIRENAAAVFGTPFVKAVLDLRFEFPFSGVGDTEHHDKAPTVVVSGMISKPQFGFGRSTRDRQLIFVNRRPVHLPKIAHAVTEAYHGFVPAQFPMFVLQISLAHGTYDVNMTPDKRTLAIENVSALALGIHDGITRSLQPLRGHFEGSIATLTSSSQNGRDGSSQGSQSSVTGRTSRLAIAAQSIADKTGLSTRSVHVPTGVIPELVHADHDTPIRVDLHDLRRRHTGFTRRHRAPDRHLHISSDNKMSETTFVRKSDFCRMEIVGQFNLGFIITKKDHMLFIVDQHASDEKYRYEVLQRSAITSFQPLVHPIELRLTPQQENLVIQKRESLRERGFLIESVPLTNDDGTPSVDQASFRLTAIPQIRNLHLDVSDFEEILSRAEPVALTSVPHCTRLLRYFASKACRGAVMIGDPLTRVKMRDVLDNMGRIEQPWNCPHGRPTMRLLAVLTP